MLGALNLSVPGSCSALEREGNVLADGFGPRSERMSRMSFSGLPENSMDPVRYLVQEERKLR